MYAGMQDHGARFARSGHSNAAYGAAMQGLHLQGMIGDVNRAIGEEMDSRVLQSREYRRMMHERALAELRLQIEREKIAAELQGGQMESANAIRRLKMDLYNNKMKLGMPTTRRLVNGRWVEEYDL